MGRLCCLCNLSLSDRVDSGLNTTILCNLRRQLGAKECQHENFEKWCTRKSNLGVQKSISNIKSISETPISGAHVHHHLWSSSWPVVCLPLPTPWHRLHRWFELLRQSGFLSTSSLSSTQLVLLLERQHPGAPRRPQGIFDGDYDEMD